EGKAPNTTAQSHNTTESGRLACTWRLTLGFHLGVRCFANKFQAPAVFPAEQHLQWMRSLTTYSDHPLTDHMCSGRLVVSPEK
ncbi:hypothetical protein PgNI_05723, partial [Pyricularia grisea]|uniref:Uncharacterized protein n=1 Tax=Pyricularia grisea TaxID=148305 RepID=A0A6P8B792_PYRGI